MKKIFVTSLLISALGFAEKKMNNEIGIGVSFSNEIYKMEKKSGKTSFFPVSTFLYKNFYLNDSEIGINFISNENLFFSVYSDLRDGYSVKGEKLEKGYKTFKNRKEQIVFGGRLGYVVNNLESYISAQGGKRGSTSEVGINYVLPVNEKITVMSGMSYSMYSKKFTDYYFGVHKEDIGGKLQKEYKPKNSSSFGLRLGAEYKFTDSFSTFALMGTEKFSKEISNSPIVKKGTNVTGAIGVKYNF